MQKRRTSTTTAAGGAGRLNRRIVPTPRERAPRISKPAPPATDGFDGTRRAIAPTTRITPTPSRAIGTLCSLIDLGSTIFGALMDGSLRPGGFGCSIAGALGGGGMAAVGDV